MEKIPKTCRSDLKTLMAKILIYMVPGAILVLLLVVKYIGLFP